MEKIYTTTSKDTLTSALDILKIQGISAEYQKNQSDKNSTEYHILVDEVKVLEASTLLKKHLWDITQSEGNKPYEISTEVLMRRYLEAVCQEKDVKSHFEQLLYERGFTDEQLQEIINIEYEKGFVEKHYSSTQVAWVIIGIALGGLLALFIALYIRFSKSYHILSLESYYRYDKKSRRHAEFLIVISAIATFFSTKIIY